ncbi:hypothetical protein B0J18DRAFT_81772 [Chaetomium sp. MPI-SDFR-AT-0129]|nr:hypothetical protein B0J18DRAFT_81772 [Chaetomium sp. MPI-SDFR-AT-0129]
MATPPSPPGGSAPSLFNSSEPFRGVVVCCTSIPTELRANIAAKTTELGGQHKYDLTPDCTHLIVGDYATPKYRHVAKERPDVRVMDAGWVEAVRNLWVEDADIDFLALEKQWQLHTFEAGSSNGELNADGTMPERRRLLCCMTGFEDADERQRISDKIEANGGLYTGDLTKRVTHLIVHKPEGRKYHAAKNWGVATVSVEWVHESVERGLILDETLYDPILSREERGAGAWNRERSRVSSLGKRLREYNAAQEEGKRKLRKTANMKLNHQRDNIWGDILGKPQTAATAAASQTPAPASAALPTQATQPTQPTGGESAETRGSKLSSFGVPEDSGVFASCCFFVHGFSQRKTEILTNTVASLGGLVCHTLEEVVSMSGAQMAHRFLVVPQTAQPDTHPPVPETVHAVTEFYIERCLHKKYFFDPAEHTIGRPFPVFPIVGFEDLVVCTAGFTGVDLHQMDKSVRQLGARYEERFTSQVSLLLCSSLETVRKQKLELALAWGVPVVRADWLWECIAAGVNEDIRPFMFPELKQRCDGPKLIAPPKEKTVQPEKPQIKTIEGKPTTKDEIDGDLLPKPATKPRPRSDLGESVFITAKEEMHEVPQRHKSAADHNSVTTHFETAPTHAFTVSDAHISFGVKSFASAPLSETTPSSLNKTSTTRPRSATPAPRKPIARTTSVADSEATDGDFGEPDYLPTQGDNESTPKPAEKQAPPPPDPEEERRRRAAEKADAERLAISNKLVTSLLDSTTAAATTAITTTTTTTTATTTARATSVPRQSLARALSADVSADEGAAATPLGSLPNPKPKRRERKILGRAMSNVSAGSSTSASDWRGDGSNTVTGRVATHNTDAPSALATTANKPPTRRNTTPITDVGNNLNPNTNPNTTNAPTEPAQPASTQLEYEDPDARRYKEQLMNKMLGKGGAPMSGALAAQQQGKLTFSEMMGDTGGGGGGGGEVGGTTRRTRRR